MNKLCHDAGADDNPAKSLSRAYAWKEDEDYKSASLIGPADVEDAMMTANAFIQRALTDAGIDLDARRTRNDKDEGLSPAEQQWLISRGGFGI